jgi:hypothetical protein
VSGNILSRNKGAGIGFGSKTDCYSTIDPDIPSPQAYQLPSCFPSKPEGSRCSFGGKHKAVGLIDPVLRRAMDPHSSSPGPAAYNTRTEFGQRDIRINVRDYKSCFEQKPTPGPGDYDPSDTQTRSQRHLAATIGRELRPLDRLIRLTPGPGDHFKSAPSKRAKAVTERLSKPRQCEIEKTEPTIRPQPQKQREAMVKEYSRLLRKHPKKFVAPRKRPQSRGYVRPKELLFV